MQPANSPDLNTLDLAFFWAIQLLQYQKAAKSLDKMIAHVVEAYQDLPLDIKQESVDHGADGDE